MPEIKSLLLYVVLILALVAWLQHGCGRGLERFRQRQQERQEHREERWDQWREQRQENQEERKQHRWRFGERFRKGELDVR